MTIVYAPQAFLRHCANDLLAVYFTRLDCLQYLAIEKRKATDVEDILNALRDLPEQQRHKIEADFHSIHDLSTKEGVLALHSALQEQSIKFPPFSKKYPYHDKALWAFLHHHSIFEAVHRFILPHTVKRYWHTFPYPETFTYLAQNHQILNDSLCQYFSNRQGRGELCAVEHHEYQGRHYSFAYPSNYFEEAILYEERAFRRRTVQPAFEVVFVANKEEQRVDVYYTGQRKEAWAIYSLYALHILGVEDVGEKPKEAYTLEKFIAVKPPQNITYPPESTVEEIAVAALKFSPVSRPWNTLTIEGSVIRDTHETYHQLQETGLEIGNLKQVVLAVWITDAPRNKPQRVNISPTSCNLEHHGRDAAIRSFLKANGIQVND